MASNRSFILVIGPNLTFGENDIELAVDQRIKDAMRKALERVSGGPNTSASERVRFLQAGRCKVVGTTLTSRPDNYALPGSVHQTLRLTGPSSGDIDTKWTESFKATTGTGFLDLSLEIRQIIYREIRDQLPHYGTHWTNLDRVRAGSVEELPLSFQLEYMSTTENRTQLVKDLNIMQTCRQIHSEFAGILYSDPLELELSLTESTKPIPFPAAYTSLVRTILVSATGYYNEAPVQNWVAIVRVANSVAKIFPALQTLRFSWEVPKRFLDDSTDDEDVVDLPFIQREWDIFVGRTEGDWDTRVKRVERLLRKVCREVGSSATVPHQFELVLLNMEGPDFERPLVDAARNLRRKPPKAK